MGAIISYITYSLNQLLTGQREAKIVIVGLPAAGKTTILYKLKLGESEHVVVMTRPTIGSNLETVQKGKLKLQIWDLGGQDSLRVTWSAYFHETNGLVLVVDGSNRADLSRVKHELMLILGNEDLVNVPLLVLVNKQDLSGVMKPAEVALELGLDRIRDRAYSIQGCIAIRGVGLEQAFDWLAECILTGRRA